MSWKKFKEFLFPPRRVYFQTPPVSITPEVAKISIYVHHKANMKLRYYTDATNIEWGGLLVVSRSGNRFDVEDVILLPQQASKGDFHIDMKAMGEFINKMANSNPSLLPKIRGWCHSHGSLGVFWSGEDDDTFEKLVSYYKGFVVGVVVDSNQRQIWRVDMLTTEQQRIAVDNIKPRLRVIDNVLREKCFDEIKQKVKPSFTGWLR